MSHYRVLDGATLASLRDERRDFAYEVLVGLSESPKRLPSRLLYDERGSSLFQQIMSAQDYYPTRCEYEILEEHADEILRVVDDVEFNLVDLGAGDGLKTSILIERLQQRGANFRYVPIDVSEEAMMQLVASTQERVPGIQVDGLVCEYSDGIAWLAQNSSQRRNLVLFLGSNIGNFNRPQARGLLRKIWSALRDGDYLFIGFDLKKDIDVLLRAYNDSEGLTQAFNLNLLTRINRELGGHFDPALFRHFGTYNVFSGAMEAYLVSLEEHVVQVDDVHQCFHFKAWEPIHTEYSYKYLDSDIEGLAEDTGFVVDAQFRDRQGYFMDCLWRVDKSMGG